MGGDIACADDIGPPVAAGHRRMKAVSSPLVEPDAALVENMDRADDPAGRRSQCTLWAGALRLHQWVKKVLLVVPLLLAHEFTIRPCVAETHGVLRLRLVPLGPHVKQVINTQIATQDP